MHTAMVTKNTLKSFVGGLMMALVLVVTVPLIVDYLVDT